MNVGTLLGLIACMGFTGASVLNAENEAVTRSILSDTINKTIESLRVKVAEYDPVLLTNKSFTFSELGDFYIEEVNVNSFSNFALTSLTANILTSKITGTLSLPLVSASITDATLTSEALDVDGEISTLSVELAGTTVEFNLTYSLSPLELTALALTPKITGLDLELKGSLNDETSEITITSEEIVDFINEFLFDYQDAINSALLSAANYLLSLLSSSSSSSSSS